MLFEDIKSPAIAVRHSKENKWIRWENIKEKYIYIWKDIYIQVWKVYIYIYTYEKCIYIYRLIVKWVECSPMVRETGVQSQVEWYQRLEKWYLIPPCLTLSIIRYVSRVKWSNPRKGVAPSLTPQSEPSGRPRLQSLTLLIYIYQSYIYILYSRLLYLYIYIYIYIYMWHET